MTRACAALLISLVGLGWSLLGVRVAHAEKLRLLVLEVEGPSLTPASRSTFVQGLMTGLSASGVEAVRAAEITAPGANGRGCADATCWGRLLANPALAPAYVVRSGVSMAGSTYQLRVEMLDARTSRVVDAREDACEICTDAEAAEALGMTASALKAAVIRRNPAGAGAAANTSGAGVAKTAAPGAPVASLTAPATATPGVSAGAEVPGAVGGKRDTGAPRSGGRTIAGWALVGAGVVAIAAGIVLVTKDGDGTCPGNNSTDAGWCFNNYRTKPGGVAAIVSGVAAGALGGWLLATGPTTHDARVASLDGWGLSLRRAF